MCSLIDGIVEKVKFTLPAIRSSTDGSRTYVPAFTQFVVARYLTAHDWKGQIKTYQEAYRIRRDAMLEALAHYLPPGCRWTHPAGGFYVWLTVPEGLDTKAMLPRAVTQRVAYVPGTAFYAESDRSSAGRQNISARVNVLARRYGIGASVPGEARRTPARRTAVRERRMVASASTTTNPQAEQLRLL